MVQLQISLRGVHPAVWRRLLVLGSVRLAKLHLMLQAAMGWTNSHMHAFRIGDARYGVQFDPHPAGEIHESSVTVVGALKGTTDFVYEYDFGDSWEHDVVVQAVTTNALGLKVAVCLAGENACPPEDCGGVGGYALLVEALADPSTESREHLIAWVDGSFDPTKFDLVEANIALQRLR